MEKKKAERVIDLLNEVEEIMEESVINMGSYLKKYSKIAPHVTMMHSDSVQIINDVDRVRNEIVDKKQEFVTAIMPLYNLEKQADRIS